MDIFTTALTKVRAVPIKPEKLRVKALHKDSAATKLSDDKNHLEQHDLYFIKEDSHKKSKHQQQSGYEKNNNIQEENLEAEHVESASDDEGFEQGIIASESVITHKQEILHPKKHHNDLKDAEDDEEIKHLDIFI